MRHLWNLFKILLSDPFLTLRLLSFSRLYNAYRVLFFQEGNLKQLFLRYSSIYNINSRKEGKGLYLSDGYLGDIILFPAIDWSFRFQRPQHFARELGSRGYRVVYVSTVPLIARSKLDYVVENSPFAGVVLVQLSSGSTRIPDFYQQKLTTGEVKGFIKATSSMCKALKIDNPTIIIQHPFWWPLCSSLQGRKVIYDCIDKHSGFFEKSNLSLLEAESQLVQYAHEVVVTSDLLAESFCETRSVNVIRNGCEFLPFFNAFRDRTSERPIIGYVGAVSTWFDGKFLFELARLRPIWQFVIFGATVGAEITAARRLPNVKFLGEIDYENVPTAIANFDVCIIPFKLNSLTLATNPVKLYEYLAAGRPVVSTSLPELAGMEDIDVFCSNDPTEFVVLTERALYLSDMPDRIKIRQNWAKTNDWSVRVDELINLIN